jgi:hypothetical protein
MFRLYVSHDVGLLVVSGNIVREADVMMLQWTVKIEQGICTVVMLQFFCPCHTNYFKILENHIIFSALVPVG